MSLSVKLVILVIFTIASVLFSLTQGSVIIPIDALFLTSGNENNSIAHSVLTEIRGPRMLSAFVVGAMLSISGALMQILLRNPLADPYILGISGGAAVAVLCGMLLGVQFWLIDGLALIGASVSTFLVFVIAYRSYHNNAENLLLCGVVIAAGWGAIISLLLSLSANTQLPSMLFWLMGDLSHAPDPGWAYIVLFVVFCILLVYSRELNLLMRGELSAASLGVSINKLKILIFSSAAILTAFSVSLAGSVGFVGLIIPHLMRMFVGTDHRVLLIACVLFGGSFLLLADTLSRVIFLPNSIPVGVVTALLGVPMFLYLLRRTSIG